MPGDTPRSDQATESLLTDLADDLDAGFVGFVHAYQRLVYSVAMGICGKVMDAEDLTSECFLYAYRALRGYQRSRILELAPRSWLLAIMHNTWRNTLRTASRRPPQTALERLPETISADIAVEEQVTRGETARELAVLMAQLPESQRLAVVLRHVNGLSTAEMAMVMGMPEGTVKSHASRGLRKLRELYVHTQPAGAVELATPAPRPTSTVGRKLP
jgi:RNA polymerase sigma factor (sigma-70 family)